MEWNRELFERTFIENFATNETRVPLSISSLTEPHYFRKIAKRNRISLFTLRIAFGYTADIFLKNSFNNCPFNYFQEFQNFVDCVDTFPLLEEEFVKRIYFEVTLSFKHPKINFRYSFEDLALKFANINRCLKTR
ncbi:hypothetical protein CEXT_788941 [Caerostris extrusa]|uniref:Uncharacterized protein n=1 Tax=Caerostris extrusa TaxID=172846 RepID=A0AAV4MXY2_CAEEX|nr:hypothetical protein CEXT_788941 [Caerostris extrusa]